jgi:hypothetical protein
MPTAMQGSSAILLFFAVSGSIFVGIGLGLRKVFGVQSTTALHFLQAFWTGFAAVIAVLQIWHLFFPVAGYAFLVIAAAGLAGLRWNRRLFIEYYRKRAARKAWGLAVLVLAAVAWVANQSAGPPTAWDSAMYHTQAVRWTSEFPVVLGLGNLHDRLGFNASAILYDALFEWGPWKGRGNHVANGLLLAVVLLQVLRAAVRIVQRKDRPSDIFDVFLLAPVAAIVVSEDSASFTTDIPSGLVLMVACSGVYRLLTRSDAAQFSEDVTFVTTLAILAVCLKASSLVMAPFLVIVAFAAVAGHSWDLLRLAVKRSIVIAVLLFVPWVIHGVALTGYAMYPSTAISAPVQWRLPVELAKAQAAWVSQDAKGSAAGGLGWLPSWVERRAHWDYVPRAAQLAQAVFGVAAPLGIAVLALLCAIAFGTSGLSRMRDRGWWLLGALVVSAALWFALAPSPRFGFAITWSMAALSVAQLRRTQGIDSRIVLGVAVGLACVPVVWPFPRAHVLPVLADRLFLPAGPDGGMYPYSKPKLEQFRTDSGLVLNVPAQDNRCFDSALPCTPHPARNLVMRQGFDGRPEFLTVGPWQQINWPNRTEYRARRKAK